MKKPIKILIIGNGFGGVYTLKNFHKLFGKNKQIELSMIGEKDHFLFTPLLHEVATGGINPMNIIEPIRKVLGCCLKNFYLGKAEFINLEDHTVKVNDIVIHYDYLVLAPGAETNFYNIPGAEEHSFTLKSIEDAIKIKNHCIGQIESASHITDREERKRMLRFVIVGGGPTGVELAAELEELVKESFSRYYKKEIIEDISIVLMQKTGELVPSFGEKAQKKSLEVLQKKGVEVMLNNEVIEVADSYIMVGENPEGKSTSYGARKKIFTDTVIWVAGVKPKELKFVQEVLKSTDGRLIVNENLQLGNYKEVFAIGDISFFEQNQKPLPALAQVAEKEARAVARNIELLIKNQRPEKFVYKSSGNLLSIGRWMAIGEISNFTFSGHVAWWIWRTVYLFKLLSWRKKIRVALDWTVNLFSPRDISQI